MLGLLGAGWMHSAHGTNYAISHVPLAVPAELVLRLERWERRSLAPARSAVRICPPTKLPCAPAGDPNLTLLYSGVAHPVAACLLGSAYIFSFALILSTLFIALMNVTLQRVRPGARLCARALRAFARV